MNNQEIKLARQKYKEIQFEKQKYEKMKQRVLVLKQNPIVQEYLNLVDFVKEKRENKNFEEHKMINQAFEGFALETNDSNKILVFMGAYEVNVLSGTNLVRTKDADYVLYRDLETCQFFKIETHNKKTFENENTVIFLDDSNFNSHIDYLDGFSKLTNTFFKELLVKPQEEVVKQFVKKYQINKH